MNVLPYEWLKSAYADLLTIERIIDNEYLTHVVAFHSEQAIAIFYIPLSPLSLKGGQGGANYIDFYCLVLYCCPIVRYRMTITTNERNTLL